MGCPDLTFEHSRDVGAVAGPKVPGPNAAGPYEGLRRGWRISRHWVPDEGADMMFWYGHAMGWWGYVGMAIAMAVFWILAIGSIAALIKYLLDGGPDREKPGSTPADVLAGRFARGDISEMEYRDRLAVLQNGTTQKPSAADRFYPSRPAPPVATQP